MPNRPSIHPTAVVDPAARLAPGVEIGPYALIEADVEIGEGCRISGHAVVGGGTVLGRNNVIHHHAIVGTDSQDSKFKGEPTRLVVGDDNVIREFATVNRATGEGHATRVGSGCRLLAYSHVAHNATLGNGAIVANAAQVGGETVLEEHVVIGGLVGIHQRRRIGAYSIVGACSKVTKDIPPFIRADGHPARPRGINLIGLERHGFPPEAIAAIKAAYKTLFLRGIRLEEALDQLGRDFPDSAEVARLVDFIRHASEWSVARPAASARQDDLGFGDR